MRLKGRMKIESQREIRQIQLQVVFFDDCLQAISNQIPEKFRVKKVRVMDATKNGHMIVK